MDHIDVEALNNYNENGMETQRPKYIRRGAKRALLISMITIISLILGVDFSASIRQFLGNVSKCTHHQFNNTLFIE
jgi:hypothetical protein